MAKVEVKLVLRLWLLAICLLSLGCQRASEVEPLVEVTDFYDRSYINNNIARGSAFFGDERYRFLSYFDQQGRVVVLRRDLQTGALVKDRLDAGLPERRNDPTSLFNPHNFISGGLDKGGRIHLLFGAHNSRLQHYLSAKPLEPGAWREVGSWTDRTGQRMTYPYLLSTAHGELWLFYRNGRAGKGSIYLLQGLEGDPDGWQPQMLIDGQGESSQYLFAPVAAGDGCVHLAWTWRLSDFSKASDNPYLRAEFQGVTNRDIAYARSCDGGSTWTNWDGAARQLPMARRAEGRQRPETIAEIDIGTGFFNHYGSDVDSMGRPHYVLQKWDESHRTQVWHLHRGQYDWKLEPATDYPSDIPWNRHDGNGLAATALARPELLVDRDDDSVTIFTRSEHHGNRLELYRAKPPYDAWRLELVDTGSLGGWEPQVDKDLYHAAGRTVLLLNTIRDAPAYEAFDLELNPQQREVLDRRARGEIVTYADYSILYPRTGPRLDMSDLRFAEGEAWIAELHLHD